MESVIWVGENLLFLWAPWRPSANEKGGSTLGVPIQSFSYKWRCLVSGTPCLVSETCHCVLCRSMKEYLRITKFLQVKSISRVWCSDESAESDATLSV